MKIRLSLDRMESYILLVAQEFLRQLIALEDELIAVADGGIPLICSISTLAANREYTEVKFTFKFQDDSYTLNIRLEDGDCWPKKGTAHLIEQGLMEAETRVAQYDVELRGNPAAPVVAFPRLRGGG